MLRAIPQIEITRTCNNQKLYSKTKNDQQFHALPKGKTLLTTRLLHTLSDQPQTHTGRLHSGSRDGHVGHEGSGAQFLWGAAEGTAMVLSGEACGPAAPVPAAVGRRAVGRVVREELRVLLHSAQLHPDSPATCAELRGAAVTRRPSHASAKARESTASCSHVCCQAQKANQLSFPKDLTSKIE